MKRVGVVVLFWNELAIVVLQIQTRVNALATHHFIALIILIKWAILTLIMGLVVIVTLILAVVVKMIAVIRLYQPTNTAYVCSCVLAGAFLWGVRMFLCGGPGLLLCEAHTQ